MKSRTLRLLMLAGAWMILGSATPAHQNTPTAKQTMYYWYWTDTDTYMEYATTATAINDLEAMVGRSVTTQPIGGTLVGNGYINNIYPHNTWPAVQLYEH